MAEGFFFTVLADRREVGFGAGEDGVDVAFAGDVFDLAAAEGVGCGQLAGFFLGEFRDALPGACSILPGQSHWFPDRDERGRWSSQ